jgi:hypothetical protein
MNAKTQAQFQNIDGNDLAQFKDARTQTVVSPSNLASGTLVYPYAKAKRRILKGGCDGRRASCRRGEPPPISLLKTLQIDPVALGIDVVVSGHSHVPKIDTVGGVLYLNPGSAGRRRFKLPITLATLEITPDSLRPVIHDLERD